MKGGGGKCGAAGEKGVSRGQSKRWGSGLVLAAAGARESGGLVSFHTCTDGDGKASGLVQRQKRPVSVP